MRYGSIPGVGDRVSRLVMGSMIFATDYPHWDADDPDEAFPVALPPELQQKIYFDNAASLYGLAT